MPQPGGYSVPPYPVGGYGEPGQAPPPAGFHMGYGQGPDQPVMYQPTPVSPPHHPGEMQMTAYGGKYLQRMCKSN